MINKYETRYPSLEALLKGSIKNDVAVANYKKKYPEFDITCETEHLIGEDGYTLKVQLWKNI